MALSALIAAFTAGLLGGVHCVAMCGGFVTAFSAAAARSGDRVAALRPAAALARAQLPYNIGRIATYMGLGAIAGGVGGAALAAAQWLPLQRALYVVANLLLLGVGLAIAGKAAEIAWLSRTGTALFALAAPAMRRLVGREHAGARMLLGMLWGLVPCGLVYAMLPIALFAGSAAAGAAVMLAFGIGTLPNLVAAGWLVGRARQWLASRALRYAAAAVLIGFAGVGLARALFGPMSHGQGAFCLVV
jgi:sulfite exporter TauE/SafE